MLARPSRFVLVLTATLLASRAGADPSAFDVEALEVPAAAGSRSPNLAVGADRLVLSWIEPHDDGHRLRFSVLAGGRWSEPRDVSSGRDWFVNWADFPSVVPIDESLWAAHWLVRQPAGGYAYDVHLSLSADAGRSWSDSVLPHDDGTPTEHGFVTLFAHDGGVGLVWLDGRKMAGASHGTAGQGAGMTLRYATYAGDFRAGENAEIDGLVCDCCQTDVAIAGTGPVAVYRNRTTEEVRDVYVMRQVDGKWQPARAVADEGWVIGGCPVNGPVIAANGDDIAVAWFTGAGGEASVRLARSSDSGVTFDPPLEVADGEAFGRAGVAFLPRGGVAVSWLCRRSAQTASVCIRAVSEDDVPGPVQEISGATPVPALNVPQLARYGDALISAWTVQAPDGRTTIRAASIRPTNL